MKYRIKDFRVIMANDISAEINNELEKRGLDARDVVSIEHYHQAVIVYYMQAEEALI